MRLGYKHFITEEDLWALPREDQADALNERFATQWKAQVKKKSPSVWLALAGACASALH